MRAGTGIDLSSNAGNRVMLSDCMKIAISRTRWVLGGGLIAVGGIAGLGFLLLSIFSVF
jgi:hypothetical protein